MSRLSLAVLMVLMLVTAGLAAAANVAIPLNGQQPVLQVTQDSKSGLDFHVEVGRLEAMDVGTKGGVFTRLMIPGFHSSMTEGAPELPMMNRMIAIPVGAEPTVQVRNVVTRRIKLADFGVAAPIMPAQPSMSKSADPAQVPFVYDTRAYAKAAVGGDAARVVRQGRMRAMEIGRLELSPVTYFPATN
ncbi:MAG TPA: C25 family peptidase propeptide domain-containing protein, partial [Candidatus Krumholzibacteria bacterium]|nr:C25 family peptidase propeptide domain-containing protein [Candidatus Krumholzibacteria bacterium]